MKPEGHRLERSDGPAPDDTAAHPVRAGGLWEAVFSRDNLARALRRVEQNGGAAGIDGMSTKQLRPWLDRHWPEVRSALDTGTYRPQPVRRVMIPKPAGGRRMLGVPTVLDRLIQQAVLQVLEPVFEPHFTITASGFARAARRIMRSSGRASSCRMTRRGWWMSIWRRSLIASSTTR